MSNRLDGYEVTRDGKVFSVSSNWRGKGRRELTQSPNSGGYPSVRLTSGGNRTRYCVHSLVAEVHLPPRPSKSHEIRHLDGNKLNANASNLVWGTAKENADDREKHGRTSRGIKHSLAIRSSGHARAVKEYWQKRIDNKVLLIVDTPNKT